MRKAVSSLPRIHLGMAAINTTMKTKPKTPILLFAATFATTCALALANTTPKPAQPLSRFDYRDVRLTGGDLKRQIDEVAAQYLAIPNDDLLKGFRQRAGLPAPGADLGGWYTAGTFHPFGQYLSGLARLHAATGNHALRVKLIALIDGWAETIAPDGFFFYAHKPHAAHYVYEKIQAGLLDAHLFANYPKALDHMKTITIWAQKHLPTDRAYAQTGSEWYTLSENLFRAYEATGDNLYRDFAEFWEYTRWWDSVRDKTDIFNTPNPVFHHAYSHLNTLCGAAMAYRVKHDPKYLATAKNGWDFFYNHQAFITGGFGPAEQVISHDDKAVITNTAHHNFEVQCGSWAGFKLSKYLIEFTGDARYGDWIEKLIINGIGASIPMTEDGRVMYYADYNCQHAGKHNYNLGWTCCTGTRPQAVADYVNLIYFKDADGVYVNYFEPSIVKWNDIELEQTGNFPETPSSTMHIRKGDKKFALSFRIPAWLAGEMTIRVNGQKTAAKKENGWLKITRHWKTGDRVDVDMPMNFWTKRLHPDREYPVAMAYGPVALVVMTGGGTSYPLDFIDLKNPGSNLIPAPELGKLVWRVNGRPGWLVQGYYRAKEGEKYNIYIDPRATRTIDYYSLQTKGPWNSRTFYRTGRKGASISGQFDGDGVKVYCYLMRDGGKAKVEVDGKPAGVIDCYGPGSRIIVTHTYAGHGPGRHEIKLTLLGESAPESTGQGVYVLGMERCE